MDLDATDVDHLATIAELITYGVEQASEEARLYGVAGAGEEVTISRNREAFRRLALRSRVLRDVSRVDLTTTVLGIELTSPVMLAPIGALRLFSAQGAADVAIAAESRGSAAVIGMLADPSYAQVVEACGAPQLFQLYVSGDRGWLREIVSRIEEVGCRGLCVTVDSPVHGRRDRLLVNAVDFRLEREGEPPNLLGLGRDRSYQARFTWDDLDWLRGQTPLPLLLKGVMHPADAALAVDLGADAVYVSNHGGRELDHALSTIEVLPSIVDAVGGRAEILLDGGVRRGTDVIKALALGARAVLVGRPQCWALAAGGSAGVARLLDLLGAEVRSTMAMMGCHSLAELNADSVHPSFAPTTDPGPGA